ncbi:peptidase M14 [Chryseobacterium sp. 6424]|uniref:M14 family zinc carboxypeptidase n=1 Tax=Chryseobacterium sp. 6424 TaxID=2039166 RepID=UPI000EFB9941|nr:M14 family zinc carboxypeptidase [Chryseobacterium sp. 6424]AYO57542.1 peptidase M14 [Chryseobacterium sp. 6424]
MPSILPYSKNPTFATRYIRPEKLFLFLEENYSDQITVIGHSVLGQPIYRMRLGNGKLKVLAWSQMHGNESTGTLAMLDLLHSLKENPGLQNELFKTLTLDFIWMLNPDGSAKWTRRNALDIDMNRDFLKVSSKEFAILKETATSGSYDYALNLHDQRTIFTTDGEYPATLSFLAPSVNVEREITEVRKKCMAVISRIYKSLQDDLPKQVARYSDEFYPTSTGDNFSKMGLPTILFEGGYYQEDYYRVHTRKYFTQALFEALKAISELKGSTDGWEAYLEIPLNKETHYDLIYRNVKLSLEYECILDIAVQYREMIQENEDEISFVPVVMEVGDVGNKKGWKEIDCTGKKFISARKFPKLDEPVDFRIE